jgi:sulfate transport system permease protein
MSSAIALDISHARVAEATGESRTTRHLLIVIALLFLAVFLLLPLVAVFTQALAKGVGAYFAALRDDDALSAIKLTLLAAGVAVPLNLVFGAAAAWAIAKFDFRGKSLLITLIDLPFLHSAHRGRNLARISAAIFSAGRRVASRRAV